MWQCFQCGESCSTAFMIAPPAGELLILRQWLITGHVKGNLHKQNQQVLEQVSIVVKL